jgi:nucleotide-binding universal stress UspA family protein
MEGEMTTGSVQTAIEPTPTDAPSPPFKGLLVPLEGLELTEAGLPFARTLAHLRRADLSRVRVADGRAPLGHPAGAQIKAAAEAYLEQLADGYWTDYAIDYALPHGEPAAEIARVAELRALDLIVMSTDGRNRLDRALVGSVADTLVRRTQLPLLPIRAGPPLGR